MVRTIILVIVVMYQYQYVLKKKNVAGSRFKFATPARELFLTLACFSPSFPADRLEKRRFVFAGILE